MATPIRIKRSAVPGRVPTAAQLKIGELALNTHDADLLTLRDRPGIGSDVVRVGGAGARVKNLIYVTKDGNDNNSGRKIGDAKATIKAAVEISTEGSVIKVSAGNYIEDNPISIPPQVSIVGDSLREVAVIPGNEDQDLFYVGPACYLGDMAFVGRMEPGRSVVAFDPNVKRYSDTSPYVRNCTNFIENSIGMTIDGENVLGPFKSMVVDSYTQYNQSGVGVSITNEGYAQLVSIFTICCDTAIYCGSGAACDLTNSNSSFGKFGLTAEDVGPFKFAGIVTDTNGRIPEEDDFIFSLVVGQPSFSVSDAEYTNTTGLTTIRFSEDTNFEVGQSINISGLGFTCGYDEAGIKSAVYDNVSGIMTITRYSDITSSVPYEVGQRMVLAELPFICANPVGIVTANYDETTGIVGIQFDQDVSLNTESIIEISGLEFECNGYSTTTLGIVTATYFEIDGTLALTFDGAHGIEPDNVSGNLVLEGLEFTCPNGSGITTTIFPDGSSPFGNTFPILEYISPTSLEVNVGFSTIPHSYVTGGTATLGITTNIFPDGTIGNRFKVESVVGINSVEINVGTSTIPHQYVGGGGALIPTPRNLVGVANASYDEVTGILNITFNEPHQALLGQRVALSGLEFECGGYSSTTLGIITASYDNINGRLEVTFDGAHNTDVGQKIKFENLEFDCFGESSRVVGITTALYTETTGNLRVELDEDVNLSNGESIQLRGLEFACTEEHAGVTTTIFPDGTIGDIFTITDAISPNTYDLNVGVSTIPHSYVGFGSAFVGITTTIFPDGSSPFGDFFPVSSVVGPSTVVVSVGPSTIPHTYVGFGSAIVGLTTNIFPDGSSPFGASFPIESIDSTNSLSVRVGPSTIPHNYVSGGQGITGITTSIFPDESSPSSFNIVGVGTDTLELQVGPSTIPHIFDQYTSYDVSDFNYDNVSGFATVTTVTPNNFNINGKITLEGLTFECPTETFASLGIQTAAYNNATGELLITTTQPFNGLVDSGIITTGKTVRLEGLEFECNENEYLSQFDVENAVYDTSNGLLSVETERIFERIDIGDRLILRGLEFECSDSVEFANVSNAAYDNETGSLALLFDRAHLGKLGERVKLEGLTFDCNGESVRRGNVIDADYNNVSGEMLIQFDVAVDSFGPGNFVQLEGLEFSCSQGNSVYPQPGGSPFGDIFPIVSVGGTDTLTLNVGPTFDIHNYVSGGVGFIGITTNVFPDGTIGDEFVITALNEDPNFALVQVGPSSIPHAYVSGGSAQIGFTTTTYPDGNDNFLVVNKIDTDTTTTLTVDVGVTTIPHTYVGSGTAFVGFTTTIFPGDERNSPRGNVLEIQNVNVEDKEIQLFVDRIGFAHTYVGGGNLFYGTTGNIFPDGSAGTNGSGPNESPDGFTFSVVDVLTPSTCVINVGVSSIKHEYVEGGTANKVATHQLVQDYPSGNFSNVFEVQRKISNSEFEFFTGPIGFPHFYTDGGSATINIVRPYDGQVIYFDELFFDVVGVIVTNEGSGYENNAEVIFEVENPDDLADFGIEASAIGEAINDGIRGVDIISGGRGYRRPPKVTFSSPDVGINTATGIPIMGPTYFAIQESTEIDATTGICTVTLSENVPNAIGIGSTVPFFKQSRVIASSHSFEYIGAGNTIIPALPQNGGVTIVENETNSINGGLVIYTSTDQAGNFRIGDGVVINQLTGTISGRDYSQSLFATITPFVLALGGD